MQDGKVVLAGGYGVRELGKAKPVDANTRYRVASNTKAMATLMLAKLVDAGKISWDTPAVQLLPSFKLGSAETTNKVLVKHLTCACTGMPRQDLEWLLEFGQVTPEGAMTLLGTMQPTSEFGDLFQYSQPDGRCCRLRGWTRGLPHDGTRRGIRQSHAEPGQHEYELTE